MNIRNDLKEVEGLISRLMSIGQEFDRMEDKWSHLKNGEDFDEIWILKNSGNIRKIENVYEAGREMAGFLSDELQIINTNFTKYPTLTSIVEGFSGGWIYDDLDEILTKGASAHADSGLDLYSVREMLMMLQAQIELVNTTRKTLNLLKESNLYKQENGVPDISNKNNQKKDHAVLLIHGIRTQAEWQQTAASLLESKPGIRVIPTRYEFFDIIRFIVPLDSVRRKPIDRIANIIRTEQGRSDKISIIAHSFGTYIICKILEQYSDIKFHRLVFCGGIVKDDFSWDMYHSRIAQGDISECHVLNDCGMKDYLPVLAKSVTWGFGSSGRFGFGHNLVKDRYHQKGHSEFFSPAFISDYWIPFIENGHIEKGDIPESVTPWWLSILTVIQIKYLVLFVILFLAVPQFNFTQNENEDSWRNQNINNWLDNQ